MRKREDSREDSEGVARTRRWDESCETGVRRVERRVGREREEWASFERKSGGRWEERKVLLREGEVEESGGRVMAMSRRDSSVAFKMEDFAIKVGSVPATSLAKFVRAWIRACNLSLKYSSSNSVVRLAPGGGSKWNKKSSFTRDRESQNVRAFLHVCENCATSMGSAWERILKRI